MNNHLSAFEQEEYVLGERTPRMLSHLAQCAECEASVTRMESSLATFRNVALAWSDACLATRPQQIPSAAPVRRPIRPFAGLTWALAGVLPILLLILAFLAFRPSSQGPLRPVASISDDALLDQVDDQLSVAVPDSMESLTHLVSTGSSPQAGAAVRRSKPLVQTN